MLKSTRMFAGEAHHFLAHRVAGQEQLLLGEELLHASVGYTDAVHPFREIDIGLPREAVLFLDERWYVHPLSGSEQRTTGIPTNTYGHLGLEGAHELAGLHHAAQEAPRKREVLHEGAAVESADGETFDGIASGRYLFHLHLPFRPHEQELGITLPFAHRIGDGDGREDVTAGASTGDHHPKRALFVGV